MSYLSLKWTYCWNFSSFGEKKCVFIGYADILPPCWMTGRIIRYNFESRHPMDDPIFDWNWPSGFTFREADLWNCLLQTDAKWWQQLTLRVKWTKNFTSELMGYNKEHTIYLGLRFPGCFLIWISSSSSSTISPLLVRYETTFSISFEILSHFSISLITTFLTRIISWELWMTSYDKPFAVVNFST